MTYSSEDFKSWYMLVIGFFYAGQGYSLGSMVLLIPLYIIDVLQVSSRSQAVAIASVIIFPWYVKFIFGFISDNFAIFQLRRKPYLVIATLFSLLGWMTLGQATSVFPYFFLSGLSLALGSAIGDAVIDGLSVEITPDQYIGRLQGINWGSRGLGLGAAGYVSANIVNIYGWHILFQVAGFFGICITVITLILPEVGWPFTQQSRVQQTRQVLLELKQIFSRRRTITRVAYFLFSGFALAIILQLTLIMETEFDYNFTQIGRGALTFAVGSFVGSIINGYLTDRSDTFGRFSLLSGLYGISIMFGAIFVVYRNNYLELVFFLLIGIFGGAYESYQLKVIQEETTKHLESTIFAIYTGISNIGQFAMGGLIIVVLADGLHFPILYSMQLVIVILVLAGYYLRDLKFSYD